MNSQKPAWRQYAPVTVMVLAIAGACGILGKSGDYNLEQSRDSLTAKFTEQCEQVSRISDPSLLRDVVIVQEMFRNKENPEACAQAAVDRHYEMGSRMRTAGTGLAVIFGLAGLYFGGRGIYLARRENAAPKNDGSAPAP